MLEPGDLVGDHDHDRDHDSDHDYDHDHDHQTEYGRESNYAFQDDVHVRAGRPDGDTNGAAGRRLHRLGPLPGQGAAINYTRLFYLVPATYF